MSEFVPESRKTEIEEALNPLVGMKLSAVRHNEARREFHFGEIRGEGTDRLSGMFVAD